MAGSAQAKSSSASADCVRTAKASGRTQPHTTAQPRRRSTQSPSTRVPHIYSLHHLLNSRGCQEPVAQQLHTIAGSTGRHLQRTAHASTIPDGPKSIGVEKASAARSSAGFCVHRLCRSDGCSSAQSKVQKIWTLPLNSERTKYDPLTTCNWTSDSYCEP